MRYLKYLINLNEFIYFIINLLLIFYLLLAYIYLIKIEDHYCLMIIIYHYSLFKILTKINCYYQFLFEQL